MKYVLEIGSEFLSSSAQDAMSNVSNSTSSTSASGRDGPTAAQSSENPPSVGTNLGTGLSYVAGIIQQSKVETFHRMIWIALRGNVHIQYAEVPEQIIDPTTVFFLYPLRSLHFLPFYSQHPFISCLFFFFYRESTKTNPSLLLFIPATVLATESHRSVLPTMRLSIRSQQLPAQKDCPL